VSPQVLCEDHQLFELIPSKVFSSTPVTDAKLDEALSNPYSHMRSSIRSLQQETWSEGQKLLLFLPPQLRLSLGRVCLQHIALPEVPAPWWDEASPLDPSQRDPQDIPNEHNGWHSLPSTWEEKVVPVLSYPYFLGEYSTVRYDTIQTANNTIHTANHTQYDTTRCIMRWYFAQRI
jgi:hypothetical protein